jgi:hypothetical protein
MMKHEKKEENFMWLIESAEKYEMDELETQACHIASMWLEQSRKKFPDYRHATMKKGDPRKSLIFKIAYKLVRETNGILTKEEYPLYIRAQLDILKAINRDNDHPLIDPNCLVGEKAWKRWKLWKKKYDQVRNKPKDTVEVTGVGIQKALEGIEKTKEFIVKTFGPDVNFDKYKEAYINNNIFRWINLGKISPYYLAISPFVKKLFTEEDYKKINFDLNVYLPCIDGSVLARFGSLFSFEA